MDLVTLKQVECSVLKAVYNYSFPGHKQAALITLLLGILAPGNQWLIVIFPLIRSAHCLSQAVRSFCRRLVIKFLSVSPECVGNEPRSLACSPT